MQYRRINYKAKHGREPLTVVACPELKRAIERAAKQRRRTTSWLAEELLASALRVTLQRQRCKKALPAWGEEL